MANKKASPKKKPVEKKKKEKKKVVRKETGKKSIRKCESNLFSHKLSKLAFTIIQTEILNSIANDTELSVPGGKLKLTIGKQRDTHKQIVRRKITMNSSLKVESIAKIKKRFVYEFAKANKLLENFIAVSCNNEERGKVKELRKIVSTKNKEITALRFKLARITAALEKLTGIKEKEDILIDKKPVEEKKKKKPVIPVVDDEDIDDENIPVADDDDGYDDVLIDDGDFDDDEDEDDEGEEVDFDDDEDEDDEGEEVDFEDDDDFEDDEEDEVEDKKKKKGKKSSSSSKKDKKKKKDEDDEDEDTKNKEDFFWQDLK